MMMMKSSMWQKMMMTIFLLLLLLLAHVAASSSDYDGLLQPPPPPAAGQQTLIISGTVACASCPNDGKRDCVGRTLEWEYCSLCVSGRTSWPCNLLQECYCSDSASEEKNNREDDASSSSITYPILGSTFNMVPLSSSTAFVDTVSPLPLRQGLGLIGSEACANCSENDCVATNPMSIGDAHCAQCAKGQIWWPCNLIDECYCKSSETTDTTSAAPPGATVAEIAEAITTTATTTTAPPTSSPTIMKEKLPDFSSSTTSTTTSSANNSNQPEEQGGVVSQPSQLNNNVNPIGTTVVASSPTTINNEEYYYDNDEDNRLEGMHVIDAHITANKIALVREIFTPPPPPSGRRGRGKSRNMDSQNDFTYHGFRSAFHTAITSSLMFGNETNLYVGEMYSENGRAYGLVNMAAFLAMSASDSIYRGGCDEVNVDVPSLPSNACGQGGRNYQEEDMSCPSEESMYDCPMDLNMIMNAGPIVGNFIGDNDDRMTPRPFYCGPPKPGDVDEGVEGCCWWGRGSIRLRGTCSYGKLNYFLGKRAADEGRVSPFPDIDFCRVPQAVCSESERYPDLPWMAGMFVWTNMVQSYNKDGFNYMSRLRDFVDGGLRDTSFAVSVSAIVATGRVETPGTTIYDGSDRVATFERTLRLLGLPAKFYSSDA